MAGGHTHEQFPRRLGETIVINPGSVGLSREDLPDGAGRNLPWGEYAILTAGDGSLSIGLRRAPVYAAAIRTDLINVGVP
jgi:predicted phosphodiesterase